MSWQPPQGTPQPSQPPQQGVPQQQPGGDLPQHARERLAQMRGDATHRGLFTSDLSVNEFLLAREAGFDALGLVMGSSIYHIGFKMANYNQNQEMTVLSQAMYFARNLAMTRMQEEANILGADGIIGVRLEVTEAVLNHVSGSRVGIVGIYQRHDYASEKRAALMAWGEHVAAIVEGRAASGSVTPLSARNA